MRDRQLGSPILQTEPTLGDKRPTGFALPAYEESNPLRMHISPHPHTSLYWRHGSWPRLDCLRTPRGRESTD